MLLQLSDAKMFLRRFTPTTSNNAGQFPKLECNSDGQQMADCTHRISLPKAAARRNTPCSAGGRRFPLDLGLLRNFQGVVDLNAEIPHSALQLRMTEQELNSPQVLGALVNWRRLGPPHRMSAVDRGI